MGVLVDPVIVAECGANAALVYGQLVFWSRKANGGKNRFKVVRGGVEFVVHSRPQLMQETGLSLKQLNTAVTRLKDRGLIDSELHKFDNLVLPHFRLLRETQKGTSGDTQTGTPGSDLEGTPIYSETQEENEGEPCPGSAGACQGNPVGQGKRTGKKKMRGSIKGLKVGDVAAGQRRVQLTSVSPKDAFKPGQLVTIFQTAWSAAYDGVYLAPFTEKQLGQLKHFVGKCPGGVGGQVLDWCVRHWFEFTSAAVAYEGAFSVPQRPTVQFLLRYAQTAVTCWQDMGGGTPAPAVPKKTSKMEKVPALKTPSVSPVPNAAPVADGDDEKVTDLDLVAKLLGLD